MTTIMHIDIDAARHDPAGNFERPMDIVGEPGLTRGQKLAALQRWADSIQDQLTATAEGMRSPPGMSSENIATLEEITDAIALLQVPTD